MNEWEEAWNEYISALLLFDSIDRLGGEDFVYWAGVASRRLNEAEGILRSLDPEFCKAIGV